MKILQIIPAINYYGKYLRLNTKENTIDTYHKEIACFALVEKGNRLEEQEVIAMVNDGYCIVDFGECPDADELIYSVTIPEDIWNEPTHK